MLLKHERVNQRYLNRGKIPLRQMLRYVILLHRDRASIQASFFQHNVTTQSDDPWNMQLTFVSEFDANYTSNVMDIVFVPQSK